MPQPQFVVDRFGNVLRRELAGLGDTALTMGKNMLMQPAAGYNGLLDLVRGRGLDSAVSTIKDTEGLAGGPSTREGMRNLQGFGNAVGMLADPLTEYVVDPLGEVSPAAAAGLLGLAAVANPTKGAGKAAKAAKAGKTAATQVEALAVAQRNAAKPVDEGGLGLAADNTAAQRAAAMSYESGFWRGGEAPINGAPNGPFYTRAGKDEATDYASRIPEAKRDVREYALPKRNVLAFDRAYPNNLATDLANLVEADGHTKAAKTLRDYYPNGEKISGMEAYKFLQRFVGDGAPESYLSRLGFGQVDGVNSPNYRLVLDQSLVRDANQAVFDPMRRKERNIFAGVGGMGLLGGLLADGQEDLP